MAAEPGRGAPAPAIGVLLPLRGPLAGPAAQVLEAFRLEVDRRGADVELVVRDHGLQGADRSFDDAQAADDARALAADERVLAVLGPFNSGAAAGALPALGEAGLVLVSPAATYIGLTIGFHDDEPARYRAAGRPMFLRVCPHDLHQGAAIVEHARACGVRSLFVLHDQLVYGRSIAGGLERAVSAEGLAPAGVAGWDRRTPDCRALMERVGASGADTVVLAGVLEDDGAGLVAAKVDVLGPNDGPVRLLAPDGFLFAERLAAVGPAVEGVRLFAPGVRPGALPPVGEALAAELASRLGCAPGAVSEYALHAAVAAGLVLDAIAEAGVGEAGGSPAGAVPAARAAVRDRLFAARPRDTALGGFAFTPDGDLLPDEGAPVVGFTVLRADAGGATEREATVVPAGDLLAAATSG